MYTVTGTRCTSVDIGVGANLELVDKFCYSGDILSVDGDADAPVETPDLHQQICGRYYAFRASDFILLC